MTKQYTADDIKVLTDREHVRLRTQVYLGNTKQTAYAVPLFIDSKFQVVQLEFIPAVYRAVGEIIDNSLDEFAHIDIPIKTLKIESQSLLGMYTISDNGRGIPIGKHETGKYTPEVALSSLRAGRNFVDDKQVGVIGQNGVGAACTNYCSTEFHVDIHRDGKRYKQTFSDGALHITAPSVRTTQSDRTGTSIGFQLDSSVFEDIGLPDELLHNRAIEIALTNPGIVVEYNNHKYKYTKGFEQIIKQISNDYFEFVYNGLQFFVIFDVHEGIDERIFSWVNSSLLFDDGICNTQFLNAFYDKVVQHLQKEAKKQKSEVTKNDVRQNLLVLGNLKISDPQYDSQAKTRLTGPNLRKEITAMLDDNWSSFTRKNKDWLNVVLERAIIRHHTDANKKAIKQHEKKLNKKIPGLVDATSKNRFECQVLITEGLSAAASITEARDPRTTASFPLTGKINNVYGTTAAQVLQMGKITDMLSAIGLIPGRKAQRNELRYGKIVVATDADYDGGDIFTLLVNLFYTFWPELFDKNYEPFVYRLVAPNVCAIKGSKRIHFSTRNDYERVKEKYKGWTINYYKGLGSMVKQDWDMILSGKTNTIIPIIDNGEMKQVLKLLFGPDSDARKQWLQDE